MRENAQKLLSLVSGKISAGLAPHAVILEGGEADELSLSLSAAYVCVGENKPCGKCEACKKAFAQIHPDIFVLSGNGAARSFHVDEIRFIREDAFRKPNEAIRKVYVLKGAEDMSENAQNALLKIIEEPPQDIAFILTCRNSKALLPTILSRAQRFDLGEEEKFEEDERTASLSAKIVQRLVERDEMNFLSLSAELVNDKELFSGCLKNLSAIFIEACKSISSGTVCGLAAKALCDNLTLERAVKLYEYTRETEEKIKYNANQALLVTSYFAAIRRIRYGTE